MNSRLLEIRESKGFSKTDIAKIMGVSLPTYLMWENGKRLIPTSRLFQLANIYEINIDYLVGLVNIKLNKKIKNQSLNLKEIAIHLKEVRAELNMTLKDLEKLLSISGSRWSQYESGKYLITSWILLYISENSGISIDYILGRSNLKYIKDLY